mgnify:CR=1 FL=1
MTLHIPPGTFHVMGGVEGVGLRDVTVRIDGTLRFSPDTRAWPRYTDGIMPRAGLAFWEAEDKKALLAEPPALASGPAEPPAARPPVYEHARGGLCCVGKLPSDIAAPPLPPTDDTGDRLAPPRSVRAETVRIAAALLAALAHADIDARARVKALAPLLVPVAATDEAVADLLFTKLRAALGDGENPRSRRKVN